jgi:hypothetical protein
VLAGSADAAADAVQPDDTSDAAAQAADSAEQPAAGPLEVETTMLAGLDLPADSPLAGPDTGADVDVPDAEAPKGVPTPKATEPDSTRISTAASSEVVEVVERLSANVGGPVLEHDELPLPDYDHMTLGSLRGRMRSLDLPQLIQIRDYEKAHADRLPIVTMLDNRIAKLANDPTARCPAARRMPQPRLRPRASAPRAARRSSRPPPARRPTTRHLLRRPGRAAPRRLSPDRSREGRSLRRGGLPGVQAATVAVRYRSTKLSGDCSLPHPAPVRVTVAQVTAR